jgi:signal transduction histidine kinase/integral membrane sensor domain MASE1
MDRKLRFFLIFLTGLLYFVVAKLGLLLAFESTNASPVWPASGLALALMLLWGKRVAPGIFLGALCANFITFLSQSHHHSPILLLLVSALIAFGNTLEAIIGEFILRKLTINKYFLSKLTHIFIFIISAFLMCLVSSLIGPSGLLFFNLLSRDVYSTVWFTWWLGDVTGVLIITPVLILVFFEKIKLPFKPPGKIFVILFLILISSQLIFGNWLPNQLIGSQIYLLIPFLFLLVLFLEAKHIGLANLLISASAIWGTIHGFGPFNEGSTNSSLILLQVFLIIFSSSLYIFMGFISEKEQSAEINQNSENWDLDEFTYSYWFPYFIGFIMVLISVFIGFSLQIQANIQIKSQVTEVSHHLEREIITHFDEQIKNLRRMAKRWEKNQPTETEWKSDAQNIYNDLDSYQALEWVSPDYWVKWVIPLKGNEKALNLNLGFDHSRRKALESAKQKDHIALSDAIDLVQGGKGTLLYIPVYFEQTFDGFITGVFKLDKLFNHLISTDIKQNYAIVLSDKTGILYASEKQLRTHSEFATNETLSLYGNLWHLTITPKSQFLVQKKTFIPQIATLIGCLFSILLGWVLRLSTISRFAMKKAQKLSQIKSEFLANMSHELRTPLNAIIGYSELILEENTELIPETKQDIHNILFSGKNLLGLVNDILDLSKIESDKFEMNFERVLVSELLKDIPKLVKPLAAQNNNSFTLELPQETLELSVDVQRFNQIILNLLSNAFKFTKNGQVILKVIHKQEQNANWVLFAVTDSGIGIKKEDLALLFQNFVQIDSSSTKKYSGTGLGLVISQKMSQLMGGSIQVESVPNLGSTFSVKMPLYQNGND